MLSCNKVKSLKNHNDKIIFFKKFLFYIERTLPTYVRIIFLNS